jgi:hypothetical protein
MGRYAGRDSTEVSTKSTATVEPEPANPEEEGPQYYVCGIVELCILWRGLVSWRVLRRVERNHRSVYAVCVWCVVNTEKPREEGLDQRKDREMEYAMGESGCTSVDMYGGAAGEVENPPFIGPAVRAPCPSRYRIVDKGSPEEDKDKEVAGSVFPRRSPADKRRTIESRRDNYMLLSNAPYEGSYLREARKHSLEKYIKQLRDARSISLHFFGGWHRTKEYIMKGNTVLSAPEGLG